MSTGLMLALLLAIQTPNVSRTPQGFTNVEGSDLKSRLSAAVKQGAARPGPFWAAYTFAVRPGVAFDVEVITSRGFAVVVNNFAGSQIETRNLGLFLLHEGAGNRVLRAEVYNLDRPHDYAGYPVYWLGQGPGGESLTLLRGLLDATSSREVAQRLVDAISAHDEPNVATTLREIANTAKQESARLSAVSWLGYLPNQADFLTALVRNERETIAMRREAAEALGDSPDRSAMTAMQNLYRNITPREVRKELLEAIAESRSEGEALAFLIETAERETDRELRHEALDQLGDMDNSRAIDALVRLYDSARDEGMKEEVLDALGDSEAEPALQKILSVAQRDPSIRIRKHAIELLGDSDDPAAARYLEQLVR